MYRLYPARVSIISSRGKSPAYVPDTRLSHVPYQKDPNRATLRSPIATGRSPLIVPLDRRIEVRAYKESLAILSVKIREVVTKAVKVRFRSLEEEVISYPGQSVLSSDARSGSRDSSRGSYPAPFDHSLRLSRPPVVARLHSCRLLARPTFSRAHESIEFPADFCSCARAVAHLSAVHVAATRASA